MEALKLAWDFLVTAGTYLIALAGIGLLFALPAVLSGNELIKEFRIWRQGGSITPGPLLSRLFSFLVFAPLTLMALWGVLWGLLR